MTETNSTTKPPPPPAGLTRTGPGRKLWRDVVTSGKYVLRPDELRILEDACHQSDRIDRMRKASEQCSLTARGSAGQVAIHPILKEVRELEMSRARLLTMLGLPEDQGAGGAKPRSVNARAAADARWGKSG